MASLFPSSTDMSLLPSPTVGASQYRGMQDADAMRQQAMAMQELQRQQQEIQLQEAQANVPLKGLERDLAVGAARGGLQRQPHELARAHALAEGAAGRVGTENLVATQDLEAKQRSNAMKKQADEMELFTQAFGPLMEATAAGDFTAANDAWQTGFDLLEKHNAPGLAQLKSIPRKQLLPQLRKQYQQALTTAPMLRQRWKDDHDHRQAMELERERTKRAQSVARTRTGADRPVNTTDAAGARLLEKYNKDPNSLTQENRETLRVHLENQVIRLNPDMQESWDDNAMRMIRVERQERSAAGKPMPAAEFASKLSEYSNEFRKQHMKRVLGSAYPRLYNVVTRPEAGAQNVVPFGQLPPRRQ